MGYAGLLEVDTSTQTGDEAEGPLEALQARLHVRFRDVALIETALRHRSATIEGPLPSNERLEFLGDSVVGLVICETLFTEFPDAAEGVLAKAKAFLASEEVLADAGARLGLADVIHMSASESSAGGAARRSTLADALEAVIAAVYLDQGLRVAKRVVRAALKPALEQVERDEHHRDFKSELQERYQASMRVTPHYKIVEESGADHDKTFVAHVFVGRKMLGSGEGKSKKQAEQEAAHAALVKARG